MSPSVPRRASPACPQRTFVIIAPAMAAHHVGDLSRVFPTYVGPGPLQGTLQGVAWGFCAHVYVAVCWQLGLLLNVFNPLQPAPNAAQLAVALPVTAAAWYLVYVLCARSLALASAVIAGAVTFCALPGIGGSVPYSRRVHELFVASGYWYAYGAHLCYEFDVTADLPVGIWCYHPHGMFSWFMAALHLRHPLHFPAHCPSVLPRQGLAVRLLCQSPLFRHFIVDTVRSTWPADRRGMEALVRRGEAMGLVPGGFHEAVVCTRGRHRVWVRAKKGFVKFALRHGYALYPAYAFGESDTYINPQGLGTLRSRLADFNVPSILPLGWAACPLLPRRDGGLYLVVGKPLRLPKVAEPTPEELDKYHAQYVEALVALFDRNKEHFACGQASLEVL